MAEESKNAVTIQLNCKELSSKVSAIEGKAIFIEEIKKVPIKEVTETVINKVDNLERFDIFIF
jgi:hypothetical protein